MRIYYYNGVYFRDDTNSNNALEGEVYFDHIPTEEELQQVFPLLSETRRSVERDQISYSRKQAYIQESDHLFFMSQRGECDFSEWLSKIAEIKSRYPYTDSGSETEFVSDTVPINDENNSTEE
jgi:hypothetical protein